MIWFLSTGDHPHCQDGEDFSPTSQPEPNSFTSRRLNTVWAEAKSWSDSSHSWDTLSHPTLLLPPDILHSKTLQYLLKKPSILPQIPSKVVNSGVLGRDPGGSRPVCHWWCAFLSHWVRSWLLPCSHVWLLDILRRESFQTLQDQCNTVAN